jgi:hypothetical protein
VPDDDMVDFHVLSNKGTLRRYESTDVKMISSGYFQPNIGKCSFCRYTGGFIYKYILKPPIPIKNNWYTSALILKYRMKAF